MNQSALASVASTSNTSSKQQKVDGFDPSSFMAFYRPPPGLRKLQESRPQASDAEAAEYCEKWLNRSNRKRKLTSDDIGSQPVSQQPRKHSAGSGSSSIMTLLTDASHILQGTEFDTMRNCEELKRVQNKCWFFSYFYNLKTIIIGE